MSVKLQIASAAILFVLGLGLGRYSNRQPALEQTKTASNVQKDKVTDKKTTIVKDPTGKETTTITEETHTVSTQDSETKSQSIVKASPQLQIAGLAGVDIRTMTPTYGAAVSKQFLGPVTLGAFGLTNGTVGVSIGMTF